jgi:predicted restriction endonuclease
LTRPKDRRYFYDWTGRDSYQGRNWRKDVLDKYGSKCAECGTYYKLECHHIKGWEEHPELRFDVKNGVPLCYECHKQKHEYLDQYINQRNQ